MLDDKSRKLDAFWDISSLVPKKTIHVPARPSVDTVEIEVSQSESRTSDTLIQRTIPSYHNHTKSEEDYAIFLHYEPTQSLIHEVTVKKKQTGYPYFHDFYRDACKRIGQKGEEAPYVPFFSYSPQYSQMSEAQRNYYLWWRSCAQEGRFLQADYSYVLLYVYELINLADRVDPAASQQMLTAIWNAYHKQMPSLESKLATWLCDFGLIHQLPPAENATAELVKHTGALMEYYIAMPDGDAKHCAEALLRYCTAYDYHSSKFATEENLVLFDRHIRGALAAAVSFFSEDGKMLSRLVKEDSTLSREAYAGALCCSEVKYRLEVRYCSFSRTNELRYLVGDIIKYAENKLRAWFGVKSRLSVYSLPKELCLVLDEYFVYALPSQRPKQQKKQERQEYDILYDVPKQVFSLQHAQQIEVSSWDTTNELLSAFEEKEDVAAVMQEPMKVLPASEMEDVAFASRDDDFLSALGELRPFADAVFAENPEAQRNCAMKLMRMPEALAEEINTIAAEILGDIVMEEADGRWEIIDCYRELWTNGG